MFIPSYQPQKTHYYQPQKTHYESIVISVVGVLNFCLEMRILYIIIIIFHQLIGAYGKHTKILKVTYVIFIIISILRSSNENFLRNGSQVEFWLSDGKYPLA